MWIWIVLAVVVFFVAYVQFAPSDVERWHVDVDGVHDADFAGGALRIIEIDLAKLDSVIRTSGSRLLAGSIEEGRITYVTRSRFVGFPDYTTVQQRGSLVAIYSRLRFGKSDLAVNRKRIEQWVAQL